MDVQDDAEHHREGSSAAARGESTADPTGSAPQAELGTSPGSALGVSPRTSPGIPPEASRPDGAMAIEVGGQTRILRAHVAYTGDGKPDAAVETQDGHVVVFSDQKNNDTGAAGPDGRADEAFVVDKETGRVVGSAHLDPATGQWVQKPLPSGPPTG